MGFSRAFYWQEAIFATGVIIVLFMYWLEGKLRPRKDDGDGTSLQAQPEEDGP
jgi:hypothetical protein